MSNISTIFDDFKSSVSALLSGHSQLTNPFDTAQNVESVLTRGYGIRLGPGNNTNRNISCKMSVQRELTLIITRKAYAQELNITGKESVEKQILEDQYLVIKAVQQSPTLGSSAITKIDYSSDNGIEFIFTDRDNFLKIETVFTVEYFEEL